jgi:hypothetical protein
LHNFLKDPWSVSKSLFFAIFFAFPATVWHYESMKTKYIVGCLVYAIFTCIFAFTADIAKTTFTFPLSDIFPSPSNATTNNGIDNIKDYVIGMIPLLTTLMAIGATVMVVL